MAPIDRELRLGLSGRSLTFPGGAPYCLVCGRRPWGRRTVSLRDPDYASKRTEVANVFLGRVHPLLAWVNRARLVSFKVEAPLCFRHYWRGRGIDVGVIAAFLGVTALLVWLGVHGKLPEGATAVGSILKGLLIALVLVPGVLLWSRGRRKPILPCEARREGPESVVLLYDPAAPRPR